MHIDNVIFLILSKIAYTKFSVGPFETNLNKLGAEGWELVQRADDFLFFKRELFVE